MRGRGIGAIVSVALLAAACGGQSGAVEVPADRLPFDLGRSPASPPPDPGEVVLSVAFVRDGRIAPVLRAVPDSDPPGEAAMRALLGGALPEERADGLASAIPPATRLIELQVVNTIAEVDLSAEFQGPAAPEDVLLRVAQVVWTLTSIPEITAVRFLVDGRSINVPTDHGTLERPVTAPDFVSVEPLEPEEPAGPVER